MALTEDEKDAARKAEFFGKDYWGRVRADGTQAL